MYDLISWQTLTSALNSTVVPMCTFLASCAQEKLCHQLEHIQSCMCGVTKAGVLGLFGLCEKKGDRPPAIGLCPLWVHGPAFQLGAKYGFFHVGLISFNTPANIEQDSVQTQTHLLSYSPTAVDRQGESVNTSWSVALARLCVQSAIVYTRQIKCTFYELRLNHFPL